MKTRQERIDELFDKYGLFDDEGYLVGPDHPNIEKYEKRLEQLSRKTILKKAEEIEAMELIALDKAYTKEVNKYLVEESVRLLDQLTDDEDDDDYEDEDEYEDDSEEFSDEEEMSSTDEWVTSYVFVYLQ